MEMVGGNVVRRRYSAMVPFSGHWTLDTGLSSCRPRRWRPGIDLLGGDPECHGEFVF